MLCTFHYILLGIYWLKAELITLLSGIMGDVIPSFMVSLTRALVTVSRLHIMSLVVIVGCWARAVGCVTGTLCNPRSILVGLVLTTYLRHSLDRCLAVIGRKK